MQRYKIVHRTYYNFTQPVALGPHVLRLRPREGHELRIESFVINIVPEAHLLWHRDVEGNSVAVATFSGLSQSLMVESEVYIQQYNEFPVNFMVEPYALEYPFAYQTKDSNVLDPYRVLPPEETRQKLHQWLQQFWQEGQSLQTYSLLSQICAYIYQNMAYAIREQPGVQSSLETLELSCGSCRDFSLLFMEAVRCLGFAARFVSGYLNAPPTAHNYGATHAWAEVYIPGAGWIGFDPTTGLVAGSDNIAVAVAVSPELVPPVSGVYTGNADSTLDVGVWVTKV